MPAPEPPRERGKLQTVAHVIVVVAAGWWMLGQLASVLRPLLIATFFAYVLLPYYSRMRRSGVAAPLALVLLAGTAVGSLLIVSMFAYANLLSLSEEAPTLKGNVLRLVEEFQGTVGAKLPAWVMSPGGAGAKRPEEYLAERMPGVVQDVANVALAGFVEAAVAGLYLLFLLMGAERLPGRVRQAYPPDRAEQILEVAGRINSAIISYLKAKTISSLLFAVPVWLVLTLCGVKFAVLWAVLTFVCNFIPYIGSVVAYSVPVAFTLLQFGTTSLALGVAVALLTIHLVCAMLVEPLLIGRAVGLSPLIVLAALAVWGLIWGLPGMVLAVPLTVVAKIVLENIEMTRPIAKLAEE
ncbi:AI-2E family transporter [Limnoglobus roseus]|uniref:AI-2E family transporter n=1 Tax=Limnoglobus roseus TaxID=2598579 RepID=UPI00143CC7C8|nr:AI-2E family transporter [Limnoglobus roseus]